MTGNPLKVFGTNVVDLAVGSVRHRLPIPAPRSMVQDESVVCLLHDESSITAVGLEDGQRRWTAVVGAPSTQMTLDGAELFVAAGGSLIAFETAGGARRTVVDALGAFTRFVVRGDVVAVQLETGGISFHRRDGGGQTGLVLRSPAERLPNGTDHLLEGAGAVPAILVETLEREYAVKGISRDGGIVWSGQITHSEMLSMESSSGIYYFLHLESVSPAHVLFTSHWSTFRRQCSVVVRIADGRRVADVERHASSLVERADGELEGLILVDQVRAEIALLEAVTGKQRWSVPAPSAQHRRADAKVSPAGIVVVQYDAIGSGARLLCLDPTNGKTVWTGEIEERPGFERTPLFVNAWSVEVIGNRVVLIGDESAGTTAQVFETSTGRRIFSDLDL